MPQDSEYIQEWPEDKLTVAQLRAITPLLEEYHEGVDEMDAEFGTAAKKCRAALDRAEER